MGEGVLERRLDEITKLIQELDETDGFNVLRAEIRYDLEGSRRLHQAMLDDEDAIQPHFSDGADAPGSPGYIVCGIPPNQRSKSEQFNTSRQIIEFVHYVSQIKHRIKKIIIGEYGPKANGHAQATSYLMKEPSSYLYTEYGLDEEATAMGDMRRIEIDSIQKGEIAAGRIQPENYVPVELMMNNIDQPQFRRIFRRVADLVRKDENLAGKVWDCIPPKIRKSTEELGKRGGNSYRKLRGGKSEDWEKKGNKTKRKLHLDHNSEFFRQLKQIGFSEVELEDLLASEVETEINEREFAWEKMAYVFLQVAYTIERALAGWIKYGFASEAKFDEVTIEIVEALCKGNDELSAEIAEKLGGGKIRSKMICFGKAESEGDLPPPPDDLLTPYQAERSGERASFETVSLAASEPIGDMEALSKHITGLMPKFLPIFAAELLEIERNRWLDLTQAESWEWNKGEAIDYLEQAINDGHDSLAFEALTRVMGKVTVQRLLGASTSDFYRSIYIFDQKGFVELPKNPPEVITGTPVSNEVRESRLRTFLKVMANPSCEFSLLKERSVEFACKETKRLKVMKWLSQITSALVQIKSIEQALKASGVLGAINGHYPISDIPKYSQINSGVEPLSYFAQRAAHIAYLRDKLELLTQCKSHKAQVRRWGKPFMANGVNLTAQGVPNELQLAFVLKGWKIRETLEDVLYAAQKDKIGQKDYAYYKSPELDLIERMEKALIPLLSEYPEFREALKGFFHRLAACLK